MARLKNYKGSVELMSGLRSKNDRGFPLLQANDVQTREDGTRLDEELAKLGGGGSAVPPVSTADNGKFLRVVEGAPTWVALQNVSKEGL